MDESQGFKSNEFFSLINLEISVLSIPLCSHLKILFASTLDFLVTFLELVLISQ